MPQSLSRRAPLFLFGVGLGAFADGIVLHQLLQWHHMVSSEHSPATREGLTLNTVADGVFHAGAWVVVVIAAALTYRQWSRGVAAPSRREQVGWVVLGWGVFNVVEGVINHHLLAVHHVRDDLGGPLAWDVGFLVASLIMVAVGALLLRQGARGAGHPTPVAQRPASRR